MSEIHRWTAVVGVALPSAIQDLTVEIGRLAGRKVDFRGAKDGNFYEAAGFDGPTPVIYLRNPDGFNLYNITHGLLHLQCIVRGHPRTRTNPGAKDPALTTQAVSQLESVIEHTIIYPRLVELGFDPYAETAAIFRSSFLPKILPPASGRPLDAMAPHVKRLYLLVAYARLAIEVRAPDVVTPIDEWFGRNASDERAVSAALTCRIRGAIGRCSSARFGTLACPTASIQSWSLSRWVADGRTRALSGEQTRRHLIVSAVIVASVLWVLLTSEGSRSGAAVFYLVLLATIGASIIVARVWGNTIPALRGFEWVRERGRRCGDPLWERVGARLSQGGNLA